MRLFQLLRLAHPLVLEVEEAITQQDINMTPAALGRLAELATRPSKDPERTRIQAKARDRLYHAFVSAAVRWDSNLKFSLRDMQMAASALLDPPAIHFLEKKLVACGLVPEAAHGDSIYLLSGWFLEHLGEDQLVFWLISALKKPLVIFAGVVQEYDHAVAEKRVIDGPALERLVKDLEVQFASLDENVRIRPHSDTKSTHRRSAGRGQKQRGQKQRGAAPANASAGGSGGHARRKGGHKTGKSSQSGFADMATSQSTSTKTRAPDPQANEAQSTFDGQLRDWPESSPDDPLASPIPELRMPDSDYTYSAAGSHHGIAVTELTHRMGHLTIIDPAPPCAFVRLAPFRSNMTRDRERNADEYDTNGDRRKRFRLAIWKEYRKHKLG